MCLNGAQDLRQRKALGVTGATCIVPVMSIDGHQNMLTGQHLTPVYMCLFFAVLRGLVPRLTPTEAEAIVYTKRTSVVSITAHRGAHHA